MWGYNNQITLGKSMTKIEALVEGAAKWKDMFLLQSAYSLIDKYADEDEFPTKLVTITDAWDFSPNTIDGKTSANTEYYKDPTYVRKMADRYLALMRRAREDLRNSAVLYSKNLGKKL